MKYKRTMTKRLLSFISLSQYHKNSFNTCYSKDPVAPESYHKQYGTNRVSVIFNVFVGVSVDCTQNIALFQGA